MRFVTTLRQRAGIFACIGAMIVGAGLALRNEDPDAPRQTTYLDDSRLIAMERMRLGDAGQGDNPATRKPLRVIKDTKPSFSSVAVDMNRDEVVATDENLLQILVYNRLANTPPSGAATEPRRVIGGDKTDIEFQCSVYVDQETGEIYSVNNDTKNKFLVFSRKAEGNAKPDRWLLTPHGSFGLAVDEEEQEMFMTLQHDSAMVVYRKGASGEEPPLRLLQGDKTLLADPHGVAVDPKSDVIFVANFGATHSSGLAPYRGVREIEARLKNWPVGPLPGTGRYLPPSITVYKKDAHGDAAPLRIISGPKTQLNWPTGVAFHEERNELFVANDMDNSILVFRGDANGDVAPIRVLKGGRTLLQNPTGIQLDTKNNELWAANFGNHSLSVYSLLAQGDTPPLRTIRSSPAGSRALMIGNPGAIDWDPKRKQILVPN